MVHRQENREQPLTNGFVKSLENRIKSEIRDWPAIDDLVAVSHTEGGMAELHNRKLLRILVGYAVHPQPRNHAGSGLRERADTQGQLAGIQGRYGTVDTMARQAQPVSDLELALQYGGSDAFLDFGTSIGCLDCVIRHL